MKLKNIARMQFISGINAFLGSGGIFYLIGSNTGNYADGFLPTLLNMGFSAGLAGILQHAKKDILWENGMDRLYHNHSFKEDNLAYKLKKKEIGHETYILEFNRIASEYENKTKILKKKLKEKNIPLGDILWK